MRLVDVLQFLAFGISILLMYLIVLAPFALLALLFYRWCVGVHEIASCGVATPPTGEAGRLGRGIAVLKETSQVLYPPWYVLAAPLVVFAIGFIYLSWRAGSPPVLYANLHMSALVIRIEVSLVLTLLSGSLIFAGIARSPKTLLIGSIAWVLLLLGVVRVLTPTHTFEATLPHIWIRPDGHQVHYKYVLYPLVSPAYAVVSFLFSLWWVGGRLRRWKAD